MLYPHGKPRSAIASGPPRVRETPKWLPAQLSLPFLFQAANRTDEAIKAFGYLDYLKVVPEMALAQARSADAEGTPLQIRRRPQLESDL